MPEYIYIDAEGHEESISHTFKMCDGGIACWCGLPMWRKPTDKAVNWGGIKPSAGNMSPAIQEHIDTLPEQRENYERMKDERN